MSIGKLGQLHESDIELSHIMYLIVFESDEQLILYIPTEL